MKNLMIVSLFFVAGLSLQMDIQILKKMYLRHFQHISMQEMIKTGKKLLNMRVRVALIIRTQTEVFTNL